LPIQKLVDRLLESPHFGERWGRHWLDAAGFAESSMFIGDQIRPGFWRYRDYVIRAFNADKPFNRFIMEQIAGDELFDWRSLRHLLPNKLTFWLPPDFCAVHLTRPTINRSRNRKNLPGAATGDGGIDEGCDGPFAELRSLPQSQVRSHSTRRLLQADRDFSAGL